MNSALSIGRRHTLSLTAVIFILSFVPPIAVMSADRSTFGSPADGAPYYIANAGQWPSEALFLTRSDGLDAWITANGIVYDMYAIVDPAQIPPIESLGLDLADPQLRRIGSVVRMSVSHARTSIVEPVHTSSAQSTGIDPLRGIHNYYYGADQTRWAVSVPLYREVAVNDILKGIGMRVYFEGKRLRYDLVAAPGANPAAIRLIFDGADHVRLGAENELIVTTGIRELAQRDLFAYQLIDGVKRRVACSFRIVDARTVAFAIGAYDRSKPLIIDPLVYSTYAGTTGAEEGRDVAIDGANNAYITGYTASANYPTTTGAYDEVHNGGDDVFVSKFDAAGGDLVYSTFIGGTNTDRAFGIAVDAAGAAYVAGSTSSTDFPATTGAFDETHNGGIDGFAAKLDNAGGALVYATYIGHSGTEEAFDIAIDASGAAYITGATDSPDFPVTAGAFDETHNGGTDAFATKFSAAGDAQIYSTFLGHSGSESGSSIILDASDNAYIAGATDSPDFPTTTGAYDETHNGGLDAFIVKFNATAAAQTYSTFLGGSGSDVANAIALDNSDQAYVTGRTASTDFPTTTGAFDEVANGGVDAFITKINSAGAAQEYSTYIGGLLDDEAAGIAVDNNDCAYITGVTVSADFPVSNDAIDGTYNGGDDAFFLKMNTDGSDLENATYVGGTSDDIGLGIALDPVRAAYIAGITESGNFPTSTDPFDDQHNGGRDVFVSKIVAVCDVAIDAGPDIEICAQQSVIIGNTATGGDGNYTYSWTPTLGLSSATSATPSATPFVTTVYTVEAQDGNGCTTTSSITITVHPRPDAPIAGEREFCVGGSTTLDAGPGAEFLWSTGSTSQTITVAADGIYTVTVTTANGCSAFKFAAVVVHPLPQPLISGATEICAGNTTVLDAGSGFASYAWNTGESTQSITVSTAATYSVTVIDNNGCSASSSLSVSVHPLPSTTIAGVTEICAGTTTTLDAGGGFAAYAWNTGETTQTIQTSIPGLYSVTVTDVNGCTTSTAIAVTVFSPVAADAGPDVELCIGASVQLNASGGTQYVWSPANGLSDPTIADPVAQPSSTTIYTVTITDQNGCSAVTSVTVTVNALPQTVISGATQLCSGESTILDAGGGFAAYAWNTGATSQTITISTSGVISVTVTDINGCITSSSVSVIVNSLPVADAGEDVVICKNQSAQLIATGGLFYEWTPAESLNNPILAFPVASPSTTTVYTVTVTDENGCVSSASVEVRVDNSEARITADPGRDFCVGDSVTLDAGPGFASYAWSNGATTQTIKVGEADVYRVTVASVAGCVGSSTISLVARPLPIAEASNATICPGESTQLNAGGGIAFLWDPPTGLSDPAIADPIASPDVTTTYTVTVTDDNGCSDTAQVTVTVSDAPQPQITADPAFEICEGASVTLDAGSGFAQYNWSNGATGRSIVVSESGTFSVWVVSNAGCSSATVSAEVIVHPPAQANAGEDVEICQGDIAQLSASGGVTYQWTPADGLSDPNVSAPEASPESTTVYTVTATDANGCVDTDEVTVTVNPMPQPDIFGATSLCIGAEELYDISGAAGNTYDWFVIGGVIIEGQGTPVVTVRWDEAGIGSIEVTETSAINCSGFTTIDVTVNPLATPEIISSTATAICAGESIELQVSEVFADYLWSTGEFTQSIVVDEPGEYIVDVIDTNGCAGTTSISVSVKPLPSISIVDAIDAGEVVDCAGTETETPLLIGNFTPDGSAIQIVDIAIDGPFSVDILAGDEILNGDTREYIVTFTPTADGDASGTLTLTFDPCGLVQTVALSGRRTSVAMIGEESVDFEFVQTGQNLNRKITYINTGTADITISAVDGLSAPFNIVSVNPELPAIIMPGDSLEVFVSFFAQTEGSFAGTLSVRSDTPCALELTTEFAARATEVDPMPSIAVDSIRTTFDFGKTELGSFTTGTIALLNDGNVTGLVLNAVWLDDANGAFSLAAPLSPVDIDPGASLDVGIVFAPVTLGTVEGRLAIESQLGDLIVNVRGTGVVTNARVTVIAGSATASPDETVFISLSLNNPNLEFEQSSAQTYRATIVFNNSLLYPVNTSCNISQAGDGLCRLVLTGRRRPGSSTLTQIEFIATIGNADATPIVIESFEFLEDDVKVRREDGEFLLHNLCIGLRRLVLAEGELALFSARPNPASTQFEVEYETIERGRTRLFLVDKLGRTVAVFLDGRLQPGRYSFPADASRVPSGAYYLVLQTPTQVRTQRMEVVK